MRAEEAAVRGGGKRETVVAGAPSVRARRWRERRPARETSAAPEPGDLTVRSPNFVACRRARGHASSSPRCQVGEMRFDTTTRLPAASGEHDRTG